MEYFLIIISAIFVNNIVLAQFLGICPFLGVSSKLSTATGMSMAVCSSRLQISVGKGERALLDSP